MWGFAVLLTAITSSTIGVVAALLAPVPFSDRDNASQGDFSLTELWRKGVRHEITRPVNILVMGIDQVAGVSPSSDQIFAGRSDTMMLVHINPTDDSVGVLSIPRDTQVEFPGQRGVTKINHANYLGGPRLAAEVVSYNLNDVEIDRYVRFSTGAFRELVDLVGGIEVYVPQRMEYVDNTQGLRIDLEPGVQILNGDEAEQFARFRSDAYGDIGRVQRQQILIKALLKRMMSPSVIPRLPQVIQLLSNQIDTNLSLEEMLALATFGIDLDQDQIRMVMLPGQFSSSDEYIASYWLMDHSGVNQVMQDYFDVAPMGEFVSERSLSRLKIAVQNASSDPGLVRQVVNYLQDQGFDNVYTVQDWPERQQTTEIIVQRGDLQRASMLETVLGVGHIVSTSTGDLGSDLTIRVGDDWTEQHGI
jgi:LCP family protein required for cell wall assembly